MNGARIRTNQPAQTEGPKYNSGVGVGVTFAVTRLVPSKPELQWVGTRATAEQLEAARIELGLDKSVPEQFIIYLKDLLHGDLGMSLQTKRPVADEIREYLPPTLELVLIDGRKVD